MLDHLADIESDMSAIHRVDDIWQMNGPRFFRLAWRLPHYRGVMHERVLKEQRDREEAAPASPQQAPGYAPHAAQNAAVGTRAVLQNDPVFSQIFGFA